MTHRPRVLNRVLTLHEAETSRAFNCPDYDDCLTEVANAHPETRLYRYSFVCDHCMTVGALEEKATVSRCVPPE